VSTPQKSTNPTTQGCFFLLLIITIIVLSFPFFNLLFPELSSFTEVCVASVGGGVGNGISEIHFVYRKKKIPWNLR
jgi:hypothetical protein